MPLQDEKGAKHSVLVVGQQVIQAQLPRARSVVDGEDCMCRFEHVCKEKIEFAARINGQQSEIRYEGNFRLARAPSAVPRESALDQAGNTSLLAKHDAACDVGVDHDVK